MKHFLMSPRALLPRHGLWQMHAALLPKCVMEGLAFRRKLQPNVVLIWGCKQRANFAVLWTSTQTFSWYTVKNTDLKNRVLRNLKESKEAKVTVCDLSFFFVFFALKLNFLPLLLFHPRFVSLSHNSGFKVGGKGSNDLEPRRGLRSFLTSTPLIFLHSFTLLKSWS